MNQSIGSFGSSTTGSMVSSFPSRVSLTRPGASIVSVVPSTVGTATGFGASYGTKDPVTRHFGSAGK
jgi:hypothetical protein